MNSTTQPRPQKAKHRKYPLGSRSMPLTPDEEMRDERARAKVRAKAESPRRAAPKEVAKWLPIMGRKLPKTGFVVAGSYRAGEWTTSSISYHGFGHWFDKDRTHYLVLPEPPALNIHPDDKGRGEAGEAKRERDEYAKEINEVLEECGKIITLSNDFPWTEEVYCAFYTLRQQLAIACQATAAAPQGGEDAALIDYLEREAAGFGPVATEENPHPVKQWVWELPEYEPEDGGLRAMIRAAMQQEGKQP